MHFTMKLMSGFLLTLLFGLGLGSVLATNTQKRNRNLGRKSEQMDDIIHSRWKEVKNKATELTEKGERKTADNAHKVKEKAEQIRDKSKIATGYGKNKIKQKTQDARENIKKVIDKTKAKADEVSRKP